MKRIIKMILNEDKKKIKKKKKQEIIQIDQ